VKLSRFLLRTCICYAVLACTWILVSDRIVIALFHDPATIGRIESLKGLIFVAVTTTVLFALLRAQLGRWTQVAAQRHKAEAELALFQRLLDRSNDAVFVLEAKSGRVLDANDTACRRLGYTREELQTRTAMDLSTVLQTPEIWTVHMAQLKAAGAVIFESRHRRKNGASFPVEVSESYVEQDGKSYALAVVRDISERTRLRDELRRSEETMATAQRIARFGSWELELTGGEVTPNSLRWSDETFRVFGLEPRTVEVSNDLFYELIPVEEHAAVREAVARALRDRTEYSLDHRIVLSSGEVRFVHEHARVFVDERTGEAVKMVGTVHDITERKRAEEQLQRFVAMSPSVLYALKVTEGGLRPLWASENLLRLTGYTAEEGLKDDWWQENLHPDDRERVFAKHLPPYEADQLVLEFRFRRKDGRYFWVHDEKRLLRDAHGQPVEVIGAWTDATERVQLEHQLRHSQKMEAIGTLAGGVAHDFNNLLTVIQGHSSLLLARPPTAAEMTESVSEIAEAAERAANLTRQLLIFSRKQIMQPVNLELNAVVSDLIKMLRRILGEDIKLEAKLAPGLALVHADRGMVEQILLNLTVNSRDAMPRGGRLTIATTAGEVDAAQAQEDPDATPGPCVVLTVSDTGSGISPEALPHIFEPFYTTKEVGKGTGLGLATIYGIAKLHGGWVNVTSEVGRGTTFRIYFPAATAARPAPAVAPIEAEIEHGTETILVVEDEQPVRTLIASLLSQWNYQVIEAGSAQDATDAWQMHKERIDLLLTDMVMPDISGRELADRLTAEKPGLKVIYTSGYSIDLAGRGIALTEGVNFLQKPYAAHRLARAVRESLNQRTTA
jgi:PAS domain S-box-containing protein